MLKNYIKIFFRNAIKHYGYSLSNIIGLAVGMVTCILILSFVRYEFNWNTYHEKYENIYRVQQKVEFKDNMEIYGQTGYALAAELKREFPEIDEAIVIQEVWSEYLSSSDDLQFNENRGFYAANNTFDVFTFKFIQGNAQSALNEPYSVILTQELAQKYFPGEEAFGKMLKASKNKYLKVTGIIENLPYNLDFRPDYLVSLSTLEEVIDWEDYDELKYMDAAAFRTFVTLKSNNSVENINEKIYNFFDKYIHDNNKKLYLKPLKELHLTAYERDDILIALYYLGGISIFVLILACINFINLSTANSNLRKKEIGIRKVVGAGKLSLFRQFIGESLMYSLIAVIVAIILSLILLPSFNLVVQRHLEIDYFNDFNLLLLVFVVFLVTGLLSGIYPALYLSSFKPVDVIKGYLSFLGKRKKDSSKSFLRKSLVTFQFIISISLIITTVYVVNQVQFMKNKDLGFNKENLLLCKVFGKNTSGNFETLKHELLQNPDVVDATVSINAPFNGLWTREINWEGAAEDQKIGSAYNAVGYDFIDTYQMNIKQGRNFSRNFSTDTNACIINETAVKEFGWTDPIGKKIDNNQYTIIGVVKDFHQYSVHVIIRPFYMVLHSQKLEDDGLYAVRIKPGSRERVISHVNQQFRNFFPDAIVEVASFDKDLQYGTEDVWEIVEKVFFAFAIIAILIAANGLFGLMSFATQRRIKEIGIRKVFGASVPGLYVMMAKEFLFILIIAVIIALPSGYFVAATTPGAYKYQMQYSDYLFAIILMTITAFAATFYHTTKAVLSNPAESLKYE